MKGNITRNLVVVENKGGTWWPYCPSAVQGTHALVDNGDPVAIIANHNGDAYTNEYSTARNDFYPSSGSPTVYFDGSTTMVGASGDMYPAYHNKVNQRMAIETPFEIDFTFTSNGNSNYTTTIDISNIGNYDQEVYLYVFITESNIELSSPWGGMNIIHFVNRLMVPDANGTALDFSGGNDIVEEISFDLPADLNRDDCEIVVAIQNNSTKEIFNGAMIPMLMADYENDAILNALISPIDEACNGEVNPIIEIKNYGSEPLTSLDIEYNVNDSETAVYNWTGDLGFTQTEIITLPSIEFVGTEENNTITIDLTNPNGQDDGNPNDNSVTSNFDLATETSKNISMELSVGYVFAGQVSWKLVDAVGDIVDEGSNYSSGSTVVNEWTLDVNGCYTFYLMDSGENGFGGFLKLKDDGDIFAYITNELVDEIQIVFHTDSNIGFDEMETNNISIYPNPSKNVTNISYSLLENAQVEVNVYSVTGSQVIDLPASQQKAGNQIININTSSLEEGIYFVSLKINDKVITKKITVIK